MGHKTVGMVSSYEGLVQSDWLWKQADGPFGQWGNIQMVAQAKSPDYLLLYQFNFNTYFRQPKTTWKDTLKSKNPLGLFAPKPASPEQKVLEQLRGVPAHRIFSLTREPPLPEVLDQQQENYHLSSRYCGYVSGSSEAAPVSEYMPAIWYIDVNFQDLDRDEIPQKKRLCSWITSGINRTKNHQQRLDFLHQLQQVNIPVEIYGRNLPDWSFHHGVLANKWFGMAPYYYNLAIENYAENSLYVSEKLWDALLSWCLPIYYGGPAANALLPEGSFLRLPSLDEHGIAYIQDIVSSPDAWYEALDAIAEARKIILYELNLLNWLDKKIASLSE